MPGRECRDECHARRRHDGPLVCNGDVGGRSGKREHLHGECARGGQPHLLCGAVQRHNGLCLCPLVIHLCGERQPCRPDLGRPDELRHSADDADGRGCRGLHGEMVF